MANDVNKRMNIKDSLRFKISVIVVVITLASLLLGIFVSRYVIESFFKNRLKQALSIHIIIVISFSKRRIYIITVLMRFRTSLKIFIMTDQASRICLSL